MACYQQNVLNLIKCFRRQKSLGSERTTVCGADNMLMILQLAVAEVNKKNGREFSATLSDVLLTWKYLIKDKLGMACEESKIPESYTDIRKTYDLFLKNSNSLDLIDIQEIICQLCSSELNVISPCFCSTSESALYDGYYSAWIIPHWSEVHATSSLICTVQDIVCTNHLSELELETNVIGLFISDELQEFLAGELYSSEETDSSFTSISTPRKNNLDNVKVKRTLKRIFCAYLNLLVNAKSDFALAQVLNCPDRGLGREAFTDLKHTSRNKQMSLYLVATSFIRTIELGGKGYAPSESDPLRKHFKGLSHFVHFIDRLDEILGETPDPRTAGEKILSTIKMHLIKGRGSRDPVSEAAEDVAQDLDLRIKNLINFPDEDEKAQTTGISPARPKMHAINHGTASCGRETIKALLILLDEEAANPPSKNKAELLCADEENTLFGAFSLVSFFRSPEQYNGSSPKPLSQRVQKCIDKNKPKLKQNLIRSQFACTYKDGNVTHIKHWDFPSMSQVPTCIHPAPKINTVLCFEDDAIEYECKKKQGLISNSGNIDTVINPKEKLKNVGGKSSKRKKVDLPSVTISHENEPPRKKVTLSSTTAKEKRESKSTSKNKLIVGQAKLTSFFRV
ncbi:PCNA-interacting partner [Rhinophrynus dorsalis]